MLSFLSPLFLVGAAAAAVPLVLHLLKRAPEPRIKFAAVKLLRHAPVEQTDKRRLRELVLLALRIAAFVLVALAFARPFFASGPALGSAGVTVIALDRSFSLSAPGRFERAKTLAKEAVRRAATTDLVGVVAFDDEAEVLTRPSADRPLVSAAIDRAETSFGATRYSVGLSAAVQALGGRRGTIVVVTDLQESGWDAGDRSAVPDSARIEVVDVGALPPNLAVAAAHAQNDTVIATVRNSGQRPRDARVRLRIDDRAIGESTVSIPPNQSADVRFDDAIRGSVAVVTVDDPDGIQPDNVRYLLLGAATRRSVLIVATDAEVGRDAFYLQQAVEVGSTPARPYELARITGAELGAWTEDRLAAHAAVFLLSTRGLERRGREALSRYVRTGGGILIAAGPNVDDEVVADELGEGVPLQMTPDKRTSTHKLAQVDSRHPVFQTFASNPATLGLVTFQKIAHVAASVCQTVARFTSGEAAILDCAVGEGRGLVFASDLDGRWNDFPRHPTFVPFVHEVIGYLSGSRPGPGEYLVGERPPGVPGRPGAQLLSGFSGSRSTGRIVLNVDPRESEPARLSADEFVAAVRRLKDTGSSEARLEAQQQEDRQHLWQYALLGMLSVLAVEGIVASRTA